MRIKIAIGGTKGKTTILSILEYCLLNSLKDISVLTISSTEGAYLNRIFIKEPKPNDYLNTQDFQGNEIKYDFLITEAVSAQIQIGKYNEHFPQFAIYTGIEKYEHLELHKTFDNYLNAKKQLYDLLDLNSFAIINGDDIYANYIVRDTKAKVITYGFGMNVDYRIVIESIKKEGMKFRIISRNNSIIFNTKILGDFNALNLTAAFIILEELNISSKMICSNFSLFKGVPGRFQIISLKSNYVIVDYAHTPNSLENTLLLIRKLYNQEKVITIFGCGGEKSKEKRPLMGKVASSLSDHVVLTNDNPRNEVPRKIVKDIEIGIKNKNYKIILDRKKAVRDTIHNYSNSVILLAGKGNEKYITSSYWFETNYCKKCGKISKRMLDTPKVKTIKYSDLSYVLYLARKLALTLDIRFGDHIFTYEEILQKRLQLSPYCNFNKEGLTNSIHIVLGPNLSIEIDLKLYSVLMMLDGTKNLNGAFQNMMLINKENRIKYINSLDKLIRLGLIGILN